MQICNALPCPGKYQHFSDKDKINKDGKAPTNSAALQKQFMAAAATPTTFAASTVAPPTHTDTTTATAANSSLQNQSSVKKSKCHKYSETTTPSSSAATATNTNGNNHSPTTSIVDQTSRHSNFDPLTVVASRKSWCCRASPNHIASQLTQSQSHSLAQAHSRRSDYRLSTPVLASPNRELDYPASPSSLSSSTADSSCTHRIRFSPGRLLPVMDFTCTPTTHASTNAAVNSHTDNELYPSCFNKFNSALTAGLLNPLSPPPLYEKTRSSPTLFEMMASEPDVHPKPQISPNNVGVSVQGPQIVTPDRQASTIQRISDILATRSPGNQFNDQTTSDIKLTVSSKDGIRVSMNVHCQILVAHSRFFAVKLSNCGSKQKRPTLPYTVEIADCDDVEIYIETLRLMYCNDLRKKLMKEEVSRVLEILKVSAAIGFDAGVLSCLEYLEAAPWSEDEEEKVASIMSELRLEGVGAGKVLKRVSTELTNGNEDQNDNEEVLMKLLHVVLEGKDEKARREMKGLVSKMLRENSQNDLRKESLYSACDGCLQLLRRQFWQASTSYLQDAGQIARQADNLLWILEILIDRQIAEDFLKTWASLSDLSELHSKVPAVHRFEVSRVTAMLFIGIGKGQILTSKDVRCLLLQTWLVPFYDDFDWMQRASKGLDRHLIEDSLGNTILTLPLARQQDFFLAWFDRFLNSGEDCPNIQRGFEVWWRRTFRKRRGEQDQTRELRITASVESS